ncbi:M48 family metallopeptidase [Psychrobacter pygoscelis]|uniref:M48 family metallopeptidase n=1 Tax=Psychrobacter pygoscelis TaxID=2488563 RepID=UPI0010386A32|nr:M48 family metallopeptidase [Psychrobacter pygoscelis]
MHKLLSKTVLAVSITAMTATGLSGCASTTSAGAVGVDRQQLLLISSEQVQQMSAQSYNKSIAEAKQRRLLDTNPAQLARLKRIANNLVNQVSVYRPDAARWNWEVHTIKSKSLNAFVMPGGKVMFYTGIIDRLNLTDDEIAAIMGHEMAHALREHSRERLSREVATQTGIGIAASVFGLSQGQAQLAGVAGDLGLSRPHSRTQESEADQIGLELMARAGYNPQAAVSLWHKMQQASKGEPPQFLSTHPSSSNRIAKLQALMPRVMPLYQQNRH